MLGAASAGEAAAEARPIPDTSAASLPANILRIDGEVGPGQWVVTHEAGPRESDIVDINRGEVIARAPGLTSMLNSDGVPLFQDDKGNYVTWNWTTNERKTLF